MGTIYKLISIIIPIYKVEILLSKCLNSVIKQSYKNIEIILIIDGSPDNCLKICQEYQNLDSRIIIINKEHNEGLSAARNTGLNICKGHYVTFIDSDDYVSEKYIEILYNTILTSETDLVVSLINRRDYKYIPNSIYDIYNCPYIIFTPFEAMKNMYIHFNTISFITVTGKLFDINLFNNLRFPIDVLNEDEFVNYKLYHLSNNVAFIDIEIYYYINNLNSITNQIYSSINLDIIRAFEERNIYFKKLENKELYNLAIQSHFFLILNKINLIKLYFPKDKKLLFYLYNKLKEVRMRILFESNHNLKTKINILIPINLRLLLHSIKQQIILRLKD